MNNTYVMNESIPEFEEVYTFDNEHRFSYLKYSNHNRYSGKGYYALSKDSLFLFYENQEIVNESDYQILSKPVNDPQNKTQILVVVNDHENQPVVPIIKCNKEYKLVENKKLTINSSRLILKDITELDSISIISPGYSSLDISLKDFIDKQSVILVNLRFIDNNYLIQEKMEAWGIKKSKKGFILTKESISKEYIKKE